MNLSLWRKHALMKYLKALLLFLIAAAFPLRAETEAMRYAKGMGIGWNLGNTLEACGNWIDKSSPKNFETAWGNPVTRREIFHGLKAAGIQTVRIPVSWSNMMQDGYRIHPEMMQRVEQVVDDALAEGLHVILNLHWDGGWISRFSTDREESFRKYTAIWTQVSARFAGKSDQLIFESLNEEACFADLWNPNGPQNEDGKKKAYALVNEINQKFVDLVRASGGGNATRYLLIAGYATNIDQTCDGAFQMPQDPVNHLMVSMHYYSPSTFAILEQDASWGKAQSTWGTDAEKEVVARDFRKFRERYIDHGVPVVIGEYGCPTKNKKEASVVLYLKTVATTAVANGACPLLWDAGDHYDRTTCKFRDEKVAQYLAELSQRVSGVGKAE
jgi:endoglucanase